MKKLARTIFVLTLIMVIGVNFSPAVAVRAQNGDTDHRDIVFETMPIMAGDLENNAKVIKNLAIPLGGSGINPAALPPSSWIPTTGDLVLYGLDKNAGTLIIRSTFQWEDLSGFSETHSGYEHNILVTPVSAFECINTKDYDFTYNGVRDQGKDCDSSSISTNLPNLPDGEPNWYVDTRWTDSASEKAEGKSFGIGIKDMSQIQPNVPYVVEFRVKILNDYFVITANNVVQLRVQAKLMHRAGSYPDPYPDTGFKYPGLEPDFCNQAQSVLGEPQACQFVSYVYRDAQRKDRKHLVRSYINYELKKLDEPDRDFSDLVSGYRKTWNKTDNPPQLVSCEAEDIRDSDPSHSMFANANYDAEWISQQTANGESYYVRTGQTIELVIKMMNNSNATWCSIGKNKLTLAINKVPGNRSAPLSTGYDDCPYGLKCGYSFFQNSTWYSQTQPALLVDDFVEPGQMGTFVIDYYIPVSGFEEDFFRDTGYREEVSVSAGSLWVRNTINGRVGDFPFNYANIWTKFILTGSSPSSLSLPSSNPSDPNTPIEVFVTLPETPPVPIFCTNVTEIPQPECSALVAIYNATNGPNWTDNTNWLATDTPCSWYGVACNAGHVSRLYLESNNLIGTIPSEILNLPALTYLYLYNNQLSGEIPSFLGDLSQLDTLELQHNLLSGTIPPSLGNLSNLRELDLSSNQLTGFIPVELENLAALEILELDYNHLAGPIPLELSQLVNLQKLYLSRNSLAGPIPAALSNMAALQRLELDNNQLDGEFPSAVCNMPTLTGLKLAYNKLTASDPSTLTCLATKNSDWAQTQTVAPLNVEATAYGSTIKLSWTLIPYAADGGYYQISSSQNAGGPYTVNGVTANKLTPIYLANGLSLNTEYCFVVRSFTPAQDKQQNDLLSSNSQEVCTTTGSTEAPEGHLLFSDLSGRLPGGLRVEDEDIVSYDYIVAPNGQITGKWGIYFDGDQHGLDHAKIKFDAFDILPNGDLIFSEAYDGDPIPGLGNVRNEDIIRYANGKYSFYFRGSSIPAFVKEHIDAIGYLSSSCTLISTVGNFTLAGKTVKSDDLLCLDPKRNTLKMYFDASDVGLNSDINGVAVLHGPSGIILYLGTHQPFQVSGDNGKLCGGPGDILRFELASSGDVTTGSFGDNVYFRAVDHGLRSGDIRGFDLSAELPAVGVSQYACPTPTPTRTNTPTKTSTKTPTPTKTRTATRTRTATSAPTSTRTMTVTKTLTPSRTPTITPTVFYTVTATRTNMPPHTETMTVTGTSSATLTMTLANTSTLTPSPSLTKTMTLTSLPSDTVTTSPTYTETSTATITLTYTKTPTSTLLATSSSTITPTETSMPSITVTKTSTLTETPTLVTTPSRTATSSPTALCTDCGPANSDWPLYRQNPLHTGRSSYAGPANPSVHWSYLDNPDGSSPVLGPDNTIYVGLNTKLYALYPGGSVKWSYPTGGTVRAPALAANGTIYVGSSDGKFYALNPDGTLKWSFVTGDNITVAPVISPDGVVYIGSFDGKFYAIGPDGNLKWSYTIGTRQNSAPTIGADGTIYEGADTWDLYAWDTAGQLKWKYHTGGYITSSPAVGMDGTIYVGSCDHFLYAINPNGTLKWKYAAGNVVHSPAIGVDGTIYFGSEDYYLYAIQPNGTLKWRYQTGANVVEAPSIDSNGDIYAGANDGYLYSINPSGSLKWRISLGGWINSNPVIGPNQTIYVTYNGTIFAVAPAPNTPTPTMTNTASLTPTKTSTLTVTATNTKTPTKTNTLTSTLTATRTPTPTWTLTPTHTPTVTRTHTATPSITPTRTPITAQFQVKQSSDDGGISDLCVSQTNLNEVYLGKCTDGTSITGGFRFANVTIPQGVHIVNASITFTVDGIYNNDLSITFFGEASGNAQTFGVGNMPINRTLTNASTNWPIPDSDIWDLNQKRTSPDLGNILQEIVNRPDWASGNALTIIAKDGSAPDAPNNSRRVFAYERAGVTYAAQLVITYMP